MPKSYSFNTIGGQDEFSDLVLGYVSSTDIGFPFREITMTKTATLRVGSVVNASGVEVASAAGATGVFVRAGLCFDLSDLNVGEQFTGVVAVSAATLNRYRVYYSNGALIDNAGVTALETRGLKVTDKLLKVS